MDSAVGFIGKDKIDAYVRLNYKGKKYKTAMKVQVKGGDPVDWNHEFWVPAQKPVLEPKIVLNLMDKEDMTSDETAGSIIFYTKDIIDGHYGEGKYFWKNIYGSPMN